MRAAVTAVGTLALLPSTTWGFVLPRTSSSLSLQKQQVASSSLSSSVVVLSASAGTPADRSSSASPPPLAAVVWNDNCHVRWKEGENSGWEMQTAVTTFEKQLNGTSVVLELHSQLHFGTADYYDYYNSRAFNTAHEAVFYELLTDETLLRTNKNELLRSLVPSQDGRSPVAASLQDQTTAQQYGWDCQVNVIDYTTTDNNSGARSCWFHADLTRQEFLQRLEENNNNNRGGESSTSQHDDNATPLWQRAAAVNNRWSKMVLPSAVLEAATALRVGPPLVMSSSAATSSSTTAAASSSSSWSRRLFTNLFLPGDALANVLRAALWCTVPSPEVSVLLLDWSSLFLFQKQPGGSSMSSSSSRRRRTTSLGLSSVSLPLIQALLQLRLDQVRQLVFGQVLLWGNRNAAAAAAAATTTRHNKQGSDSSASLLIEERNDHALKVVQHYLESSSSSGNRGGSEQRRLALLYGSSHCPDLHHKLQTELGFVPVKQEWRTAWSVSTTPALSQQQQQQQASSLTTQQEDNDDGVNSSSSQEQQFLSSSVATIMLIVLPLYLALGGWDWISTWQSLLESTQDVLAFSSSSPSTTAATAAASAAVEPCLYLARHVFLYVALSKFLIDWRTTTGNNNSES